MFVMDMLSCNDSSAHVDHRSVHNFVDGYEKVAFAVPCIDGTVYDAATGSCVSAVGGQESGTDDHTTKYTAQRYLTTVFDIHGDALEYKIFAANTITDTGLDWQCIGTASFIPHIRTPKWVGEKSFDYWFTGNGQRFCIDGLLARPGKMLVPEKCYSLLWKGPIPDQIEDISMREFLRLWRNGDLQRMYHDTLDLRKQKFGVEIEFTGMTRQRAAELLADSLDADKAQFSRTMNGYFVRDAMGRPWRIVCDDSIEPIHPNSTEADSDCCCELVTPICDYSDITTILNVVNRLRSNGMCVNDSCGIHIHVSEVGHTAKTLRNLVNTMANMESLLFDALKVPQSRYTWCQGVDAGFASRINSEGIDGSSLDEVESLWYNGSESSDYASYSRNRALNLASMWQGKGIEFRMFNSTTIGKEIKAYIQLCLAICNQAKRADRAETLECGEPQSREARMVQWLNDMGLNRKESLGVRQYLIDNINENERNRRTA